MIEEEKLKVFADKVDRIKAEIAKKLIGQDEAVEKMIVALLVGGHILIEGMPGLAKTLAARLLSKTLEVDFKRIQFTPDLMPSDILGTSVYNFSNSTFEFKAGPVFSNFILIDEINRAPAKTQAALFELMEEKQVSMDGTSYPMQKPFMVVATQNPVETEGTYRLPEAQMDRFLFRIHFNYPNLEEEIRILQTFKNNNEEKVEGINAIWTGDELLGMRSLMDEVHIEDRLIQFIAKIIQATREHPDLEMGASPRAGIGWMHAAKALAIVQGRDFVVPDDIVYLGKDILNHRIYLRPEREIEGVSSTEVAQRIIKSIEVPQ